MAKSSIRFERSFGVLIPGISRHSSMKRDNLPITNGMIARVTRLDRFRSARGSIGGGGGGKKKREREEKKRRKKRKNATKGEQLDFLAAAKIIKIVFPPR